MTEKEISGAELEIIQILWDLGKPSKIQEICDYSGGSSRNYSTTATLLGRMKEKGAVKAERVGKTFYYSPLISKTEYVNAQTKRFISRLYDGSVKTLAAALVSSDRLTAADMTELRDLLEKRIEKGGNHHD